MNQTAASEPNTQAGPSQRGNILIVDDVPANLRLLSNMLNEQGYKVRSVINGKMALMAARAASPDLILLDVNMPGMDGYEVCQQLKVDKKTTDIPIIFISALDNTEGKVRAFTVGGVDYITKPFQIEEVLARVQTHLSLRNLQHQLKAANDELARRLKELEQANAELKASNAELDAFSHTVAHDLKNPLGGLIGYAELLSTQFDTLSREEAQQIVEFLVNAGWRMNNIIKELLLLAHLRDARLDMRPVDMASVVSGARQRLAYMVDQFDAQIIEPEDWPEALGYDPWLEEVWANYISNAIKYGGQPPIVELGATLLICDQGQNGCVEFWVRDNGNGISAEDQKRLFVPFSQLHHVRAQGHGLGLSIVQRIVEKLGGQVGIKSEAGRGSVFSFTLPLA